jgi:hypothetical protein
MNEFTSHLAALANGRGTVTARLARMHKHMINNGAEMLACSLPAGSKRVALTNAMMVAQTPIDGDKAECIICAQPMSLDYASTNPAYPMLTLLIPSILFDEDDEITGTDKATAHRVGYVAGNVALACQDCNAWKTAAIRRGDALVFDASALGDMAERVMLTWDGITTARRSDTESDAAKRSRARRKAAREARGYIA